MFRFACDFYYCSDDQVAESPTHDEGEFGQDLTAELIFNADGRTVGNQQGERVPGKDKVDLPLKW